VTRLWAPHSLVSVCALNAAWKRHKGYLHWGTSLIRNRRKQDPTVGPFLGPYMGRRGLGVFLWAREPLYKIIVQTCCGAASQNAAKKQHKDYKGASLMRNNPSLGPYSRTMPTFV